MGRGHLIHHVAKPRQFTSEEGVVSFHDVVGQLARCHRGAIDTVEILVRLSQIALGDLGHDAVDGERALSSGLYKRGCSMTAVIDSEALEDVRAAEPLGNDGPDGRFMRDVHGRPPFVQACATCHGASGKGDGVQEQHDESGVPIRPRDLTRGVFKGGRQREQLHARIMLGERSTL